MAKANKIASVYNVAGVEVSSIKTAHELSKNFSNEVAAKFAADNCSPFAFCKWLSASVASSEGCRWFAVSVLGLKGDEIKSAETILHALRAAYPIVNERGELCHKKTMAKGVFAVVPFSVFNAAIIDTIIMAYLRNNGQTIQIKYPSFYEIGEDSAINEISAEDASKRAEDAASARKDAAASKAAKLANYEDIKRAAAALVAATAASKAANIASARAELAELLGL